MASGTSTPLSSSTTLTNVSDENEKPKFSLAANLPASTIIEWIASKSSSSLYLYDLAVHAGFGAVSKALAEEGHAPVRELQTRAGAGLALVGRLSEGTSKQGEDGSVITAFTTPPGLVQLTPSLNYLPPASPNSRLVIQVPTITAAGPTFLPTLAGLTLPQNDDTIVIFSATAQESLDLAAVAYRGFPDHHVIHFFDHHSSSREVAKITVPSLSPIQLNGPEEALQSAGYNFFDYIGDPNAETVLVVLNGPYALSLEYALNNARGVGLLVVRVLRPWEEESFRDALPKSAKKVVVLEDAREEHDFTGILYGDVLGSLLGLTVSVHSQLIKPTQLQSHLSSPRALKSFIRSISPGADIPTADAPTADRRLHIYSAPGSPLTNLGTLISRTFFQSRSIRPRLLTDYDEFSRKGGIARDRISLAPTDEPHAPFDFTDSNPDFTAILDASLLKTHSTSILSAAKDASLVLVAASANVNDLPRPAVSIARRKGLRLFFLDAAAGASKLPVSQKLLAHFAFLSLYFNGNHDVATNVARAEYGENVEDALQWVKGGLVEAELPVEEEPDQKEQVCGKEFGFNALNLAADALEADDGPKVAPWHVAAKHILFSEAYAPTLVPRTEEDQIPELRPALPTRTYLLTTSVNRRLTPTTYDRNVFHLEFDTTGTGLTYAVGEALGIHGWNDEGEVREFCAWYGVDPDEVITLPVPSTAQGEEREHTRTVFQALQQQLDIFGRPPKSFYAALAAHATARADAMALRFISSPEGSSTFKKMGEKDTVTFADVLKQFPSARPSIRDLWDMVGEIKERHYSIASAQSAVGNSVHLLVVTVDWVTPSGTPRFGQCTRYLAGLKVGQKVTVSIKPSVMKLPPDNMQPIIMAGLGTGAAPFRAFIQHRAHLAAQKIPVGPLLYYFGSRHRSQEYLYGEEIEAYIADGIVTHAGLAFSRDGKNKVYIQHLMQKDGKVLSQMLDANADNASNKGYFYLCGPTWPVPDVYEALVNALVQYGGRERSAAEEYLEGLKEEERYVLEVY